MGLWKWDLLRLVLVDLILPLPQKQNRIEKHRPASLRTVRMTNLDLLPIQVLTVPMILLLDHPIQVPTVPMILLLDHPIQVLTVPMILLLDHPIQVLTAPMILLLDHPIQVPMVLLLDQPVNRRTLRIHRTNLLLDQLVLVIRDLVLLDLAIQDRVMMVLDLLRNM